MKPETPTPEPTPQSVDTPKPPQGPDFAERHPSPDTRQVPERSGDMDRPGMNEEEDLH